MHRCRDYSAVWSLTAPLPPAENDLREALKAYRKTSLGRTKKKEARYSDKFTHDHSLECCFEPVVHF